MSDRIPMPTDGNIHRISMRGPWTMQRRSIDNCISLTAKRQFHAPPPFVATPVPIDLKLYFAGHCAFPINSMLINKIQQTIVTRDSNLKTIPASSNPELSKSTSTHFAAEIGTEIARFNEVEMNWLFDSVDQDSESQAIMQFVSSIGESAVRYSPGPLHPLHFDTWLEIHDSSAT